MNNVIPLFAAPQPTEKPKKIELTYQEATSLIDSLEDSNPERYALVQSILERIQSEEEWCTEYYKENEDNVVADYVSSLGYREGMHEVEDRVNDMDIPQIMKDWINAQGENIADYCSLELAGIYRVENEIYSMTIGEQEHEISEELKEELAKLTPEEVAAIELKTGLRGHYIYVPFDYDRWVMVLDFDRVAKEVIQSLADDLDIQIEIK